MRRVLRSSVPADGTPADLPHGQVVFFGRRLQPPFGFSTDPEVWVEVAVPDDWPTSAPGSTRKAAVIQTAAVVPDGAEHLASALDGSSVLHLYELAEAAEVTEP